jgi:dipeptidyl aminopeptidase/acylaminoacyl peptidase
VTTPLILPHGTWPSPITAALVSGRSVSLGLVALDGDRVVWTEGRPLEKGRVALLEARLDGGPSRELAPASMSVRSRVHEYGGGAALARGGATFAVDDADQRLHLLPDPTSGEAPRALTPAGVRCADADLSPDGRWVVLVGERERDSGREPEDLLLAVPTDGVGADGRGVVVLASGRDFFASPRFSPDGETVAFLAWDHPDMPWDRSELCVVSFRGGEASLPRTVAGGGEEAIFQPGFSPGGTLTFVSDRTGFWNLYQSRGLGAALPLAPLAMDFGQALWSLGARSWGFLDEDRLVAAATDRGVDRLFLLHLGTGRLEEIATPFCAIPDLCTRVADPTAAARVAVLAGGLDRPRGIAILDPGPTGAASPIEIARSFSAELEPADLSRAEAVEFPTANGERAHGFFYAPRSASARGPEGALPVLLVQCHGGPTSASSSSMNLTVQFWTSRGFALLDVNHRGSTGFGRDYRRALEGLWGIAEVEDCEAGALHLVRAGLVDARRLAIRGGSAGGYTVLRALTAGSGVFAAGASYYGIGDLLALARETHKFEAHYLDRLVGRLPEEEATYRARSPLAHVDRLRTPILLLQGKEDRVVPPSQATAMAAALDRHGVTHALLLFEGEGHGFRRSETIERALTAELAFYAHVFGLDAGPPPPWLRGS